MADRPAARKSFTAGRLRVNSGIRTDDAHRLGWRSEALAKAALGEEGMKAYALMNPLQRMGDPAELGAAAAFLASPDSSFMTASEVAVDGGLAQI